LEHRLTGVDMFFKVYGSASGRTHDLNNESPRQMLGKWMLVSSEKRVAAEVLGRYALDYPMGWLSREYPGFKLDSFFLT
jgi:hypothetical protein